MRDGGSTKLHPCFEGRIVAANGQEIVATGCFLGVRGNTAREAEANAELIVRAVNSLEANTKQLAALREALDSSLAVMKALVSYEDMFPQDLAIALRQRCKDAARALLSEEES
jgi:hypothetical protein